MSVNVFTNIRPDSGGGSSGPTGPAGGDLSGTYPNPTIATVNSNVGSFGTAANVSSITVNAKGQVTAASNTPIQITESQVTNLTTDLARVSNAQALFNYYNFF